MHTFRLLLLRGAECCNLARFFILKRIFSIGNGLTGARGPVSVFGARLHMEYLCHDRCDSVLMWLSIKQRPIQTAVLNRFQQMRGFDVFRSRQIRNCSRYF